MRASDKAWVVLGAGILAWDVLCPRGEMLSDGTARYMASRPVLTGSVIAYTACHLAHVIPARLDLFSITSNSIDLVRDRIVEWGEHDPLTRLAKALGR